MYFQSIYWHIRAIANKHHSLPEKIQYEPDNRIARFKIHFQQFHSESGEACATEPLGLCHCYFIMNECWLCWIVPIQNYSFYKMTRYDLIIMVLQTRFSCNIKQSIIDSVTRFFEQICIDLWLQFKHMQIMIKTIQFRKMQSFMHCTYITFSCISAGQINNQLTF